MKRDRTEDKYRLIGALVSLQERRPRRLFENDRDYIIRLAQAIADDGYWLEWAPREPLTAESLFGASYALLGASKP